MTQVITKSAIISALACCAIQQSPYLFPAGLEKALQAVSDRLDGLMLFPSKDKKSINSYLEMPKEHIEVLIKDLIHNTPEVGVWNLTKFELDKGITDPNDPNRPVKFGVASRYDHPKADYDFIDIWALERNVCAMVINKE